jgi:hypothetical protein
LYSRAFGGVRVEDAVVVMGSCCEGMGSGLMEGLEWEWD